MYDYMYMYEIVGTNSMFTIQIDGTDTGLLQI